MTVTSRKLARWLTIPSVAIAALAFACGCAGGRTGAGIESADAAAAEKCERVLDGLDALWDAGESMTWDKVDGYCVFAERLAATGGGAGRRTAVRRVRSLRDRLARTLDGEPIHLWVVEYHLARLERAAT